MLCFFCFFLSLLPWAGLVLCSAFLTQGCGMSPRCAHNCDGGRRRHKVSFMLPPDDEAPPVRCRCNCKHWLNRGLICDHYFEGLPGLTSGIDKGITCSEGSFTKASLRGDRNQSYTILILGINLCWLTLQVNLCGSQDCSLGPLFLFLSPTRIADPGLSLP